MQEEKSKGQSPVRNCAIKDNKKHLYKYRSKSRAKEKLHPLLDAGGSTVTKNEDKAEALNAFSAPLMVRPVVELVTLSPELRDRERGWSLLLSNKWKKMASVQTGAEV